MQSEFNKKKTLMNMKENFLKIFDLNFFDYEQSLPHPKIHINADESGLLNENIDLHHSLCSKEVEKAIKEIFQLNSSNDEISLEKNEMKRKNIHSFNAQYISKKRGRKTTNIKNRIHSSSDFDNILRKIQVHFLNFTISLLNEIIFTFLGEKNFFSKFNYDDKKNITHDYVESLKNLDLKTLIETIKISPKYKLNDDINKVRLQLLSNHPWSNEILSKKISDIFNLYYYKKEPLKLLILDKREVKLSKSVKNFSDLIQNKKNENITEKLTKIAQVVYLNNEKIVQFKLVKKK